MTAKLFSPIRLRELELPNRVVVSPMQQYSADDGCATQWHLMHLGNLAVSGAGLLIIEGSAVHPNGRLSARDLGLWSDKQADALEPVIAFCRKFGDARIGIQLWHGGRKGSVGVGWEKQEAIPEERGGWTIYSASPVPYPGRATPVALDKAGIHTIIDGFASAARRADRLGIDLIEIHGAHGYLIHNFLSPLSNRREDDYGGSLENRMRFGLEVFAAVRATWPAHKPLGMRISSVDWVEGGWSLEDSIVFVEALRKLGCDYVTASGGGTSPQQKITTGPGYQVPFAQRIRRETGMPTMAVGLITEARQAEEILASEKADMVALARGMLYDPRWAWHAAAELGADAFCPPQYNRSLPTRPGGAATKAIPRR